MEKKRYLLLGIILICQIGLFFLLKFHFFEKLDATLKGADPVVTNNLTDALNNTVTALVNDTIGNSTLANSTSNGTL